MLVHGLSPRAAGSGRGPLRPYASPPPQRGARAAGLQRNTVHPSHRTRRSTGHVQQLVLRSGPGGSRPQRRGLLRRLRRQVHPGGARRRRGRGRRRVREGQGRPGLRGRAQRPDGQLHRPAQRPHRGAAVRRARRGRPDLPQARGPQPHRLAQDQQRAGPGAAHQAHGQDPRHRRDRSRPARRRHRHRLRALRPRVHRLHGRDRHPAPGPERGPDADAGRRGHRREVRLPDPQGRHQRGVPRLGRQCGPHPLPLRHGRRSAPLPGHGPRLPPGHRRRGPPPDPGARRPAARRRRGLRRRRLERHRPLPRLHPGRRRPPGRLRARRTRSRDRRARGHADRGRAGHPARLPLVRPPGRGGPDHRAVLDLGRSGLPGHRPGALVPQGQRPRRVPRGHRRRRDAGPAPALPHRGHHPGHRVGARARGRPRPGQGARQGRADRGQPVRPRRQGHGHGSPLLRAVRRRAAERDRKHRGESK